MLGAKGVVVAVVAVGAVVGEGPGDSQCPILFRPGDSLAAQSICVLGHPKKESLVPSFHEGDTPPQESFPCGPRCSCLQRGGWILGPAALSLPQWPHCSAKGFPLPTGWSPSSWAPLAACQYTTTTTTTTTPCRLGTCQLSPASVPSFLPCWARWPPNSQMVP